MPPAAPNFRPLDGVAGVRATFVPRIEGVDVATDRETALERLFPAHRAELAAAGLDPACMATAEQVHGDGVAVATDAVLHRGVDGLVTTRRGLVLGIYVADCAAVYMADRRGQAAGLVHSGRAGTARNIAGRAIALMRDKLGINPADLIVHLSPCIRPPLYETDFASEIIEQARSAGAGTIIDDGICTGRSVEHYYSYRVERGRTGRMLAALALMP